MFFFILSGDNDWKQHLLNNKQINNFFFFQWFWSRDLTETSQADI